MEPLALFCNRHQHDRLTYRAMMLSPGLQRLKDYRIPLFFYLIVSCWTLALVAGCLLPLSLELFRATFNDSAVNQKVDLPLREWHPRDVKQVNVQTHFSYQPYQSAIVRIGYSGWLEKITVNHKNLPLYCSYGDVYWGGQTTIDLAPYLQPGMNTLRIIQRQDHFKDHFINIYTVPGAAISLLVTLLLVAPWLIHVLVRAWPRRAQFTPWLASRKKHFLVSGGLLLLAVWFKYHYIAFSSADYAVFLTHWMDQIRKLGITHAYSYAFSNYAPFYLYLMGIADLFAPFSYKLYVIKYLTFVFEIYAASWAYRLLALYYKNQPDSLMPWAGACALLAAPSVILNGAGAGQCDIIMVSFALGCLYHIICRNPARALLYFGLAASFKLQVIFIAPVLLAFWLRRFFPWYCLWLPVGVYVALCIPAFMEGWSMSDLLSVYWRKFSREPINMNAANIYLRWDPDEDPTVRSRVNAIALGIPSLVAAYFAFLTARRWQKQYGVLELLLVSSFFAGLMPYILPRMHDRYFFIADILTFMLAFVRPRWFYLTVLFQLASAIATPSYQAPSIVSWFHWYYPTAIYVAVFINFAAIMCCFYLCGKYVWVKSNRAIPSVAEA